MLRRNNFLIRHHVRPTNGCLCETSLANNRALAGYSVFDNDIAAFPNFFTARLRLSRSVVTYTDLVASDAWPASFTVSPTILAHYCEADAQRSCTEKVKGCHER